MVRRAKTAVVGLKVRLREPLRKELEVAAKKKGVSLNSELVARLEKSFSEQAISEKVEQVITDKLAELLDRMQSGPPEHWSEEAKAFDKSLQPVRRKQRQEAEERRKEEIRRMEERNEKYMRSKFGDKS